MIKTATKDQTTPSKLELARALDLPSRQAMLERHSSVSQFWSQNKHLLAEAWREWEEAGAGNPTNLDDSFLDSNLREAVEASWKDPSKESLVEKIWAEVSPGVYQAQFFDPTRLKALRDYLDDTQSAGIPLRPPHGIALNRFGAMLDKRSEGYLAAPGFQAFYDQLLDKYMRPIARLLFPEIIGYDSQTFGFSIQYQPGVDTSLQLHTDASAATLNINLNLPDESFAGSELDFLDPHTGSVNRVSFTPGVAMIHRGTIAHAARPITSGQRTNFVLWLYGNHMSLPRDMATTNAAVSPEDRWTIPSVTKDDVAPF